MSSQTPLINISSKKTRRPGRPRGSVKNSVVDDGPKRKPGRPKGSRNKQIEETKATDNDMPKTTDSFIKYIKTVFNKPNNKRALENGRIGAGGQGRKASILPDTYTTRNEFRRMWKLWAQKEVKWAGDRGLENAMSQDTAQSVQIIEDGILQTSLDSLYGVTLNDFVYLSQIPKIHRFNPDQFAFIRSVHNVQYQVHSPNTNLRLFQKRLKDNEFDSKKVQLVMMGSKAVDNFTGTWYIHSILNLTTFERVFNALQRRGMLPLEDILLTGRLETPFEPVGVDSLPIRRERLVGKQLEAVEQICGTLEQPGFHLIHGPPGTGKTTTLLETLYGMCRMVSPGEIIVTGSGNATIGDLVERIMQPDSEVMPPDSYLMVIGHQVQLNQKSYPYAMFTYLSITIKRMIRVYMSLIKYQKMMSRGGFGQCDKIIYQTEQFTHDIAKMRQLPCKPTKVIEFLEKIQEIWEEIWTNQVMDQFAGIVSDENTQITQLLDDCILEVSRWCFPKTLIPILINGAQLVCCTNSQAMNKILKDWPFKYVLEDEAAQCIELESLLAMRKDTVKAILIGDPYQLSGFVQNPAAKAALYGRSLMRRLSDIGYPSIMLDKQYRMDRLIADFPSNYIYDGNLTTGDSIDQREPYPIDTYQLIDVIGKEQLSQQKSFFNLDEVSVIVDWLNDHEGVIPMTDIAIITPYQAQCHQLTHALQKISGLTIQTIDGYQGQENKTVLLSLVRSGGSGIGFLSEKERMNVALTRAQRAFRIFGNLEHFANKSPHWAALIADAPGIVDSTDTKE